MYRCPTPSQAKPSQASYDEQLPELVVTEDDEAPEDNAILAESVGQALLVVLDTLRPAERLAFVLHDMFALPFDEIGQIIGKSPDASKMLASRARGKVRGTQGQPDERQQRREVVDAFLAAARDGETSRGCCGCSIRTSRGVCTPRVACTYGWGPPRSPPRFSVGRVRRLSRAGFSSTASRGSWCGARTASREA